MVRRTLTLFILTLFVGLAAGVPASEAQVRQTQIGFVDPLTVLQRMPDFAAVQQSLQNFQQRKQQELAQKEQEFQTAISEYQQKSAVISDEAATKEEERLGQLSADLQQFEQQVNQEVQQKQQELLNPLLEKIQGAINTVAEQNGLDYVLNTRTYQGDMIILYASPQMRQNNDITDQVMQQLGI